MAFFSFQPRIAPLDSMIHLNSPYFASGLAAIFRLLPAPVRLPAFSAAAATCCLAGSVPATSVCAASRASVPAICGSTKDTATNPTSARPAMTRSAARITYSPYGPTPHFTMAAQSLQAGNRGTIRSCA